MKWYDIRCDGCHWSAQMVDERVADKFRRIHFCEECRRNGRTELYKITDHITNTPKGGR